MIVVEIGFLSKKSNKWQEDEKQFNSKESALRGMYALKRRGIKILGWRCTDSYDNEWLWLRFNH